MAKQITLTIDGQAVSAPEGTLIVDAAKQAGIDIPVFCYHPKLHPAGMCRMCLVEIGRPMIDRATGQPVMEDGHDGVARPKIQFGPKLETSCTTPISEGMVVITASEKVTAARKDMVEFILTSHPLDCPVCDKGGECPLQNLTMAHGSGTSRYVFDEKHHGAKHVPLGELIFLDRERCIQCGRCVRFQEEIAADPVIGFYNRGRNLEIVTFSDPGFDSIFSGNTTDICPVGALTTADFRFGARPWEMRAMASVCSHCPVGCNITFDVRREAQSGGKIVIKRAMPRQNETVNEIWMCDKGRFAYHYTESPQRLTTPLVRLDGELVPATWEVALGFAADGLCVGGENLLALGSGRLANEDLFTLRKLAEGMGGKAQLYTHMAGGDFVAQAGMAPGSNLADLGKGTAILVVASDLHQEAPIWWLRVKQAAERGAALIVASARPTRLDRYAKQTIRYSYGEESAAVWQVADLPAWQTAENAVIFYGSDGLGLAGTQATAQACAEVLAATGHVGRVNNGLIPVWSRANDQGAWEMGLRPPADWRSALEAAKGLYIVAADPFGDDPALLSTLHEPSPTFLVVQDLFLTETARHADVVLPAQVYTERDGTFTSGERRVQRYYPAVPPTPECRPDYAITAALGEEMGLQFEGRVPAAIFAQIVAETPAFAGLTYRKLAETAEQQPLIGRGDLYYGGTGYENKQGLGVTLTLKSLSLPKIDFAARERGQGLWAVPVTKLYDRGQTVTPSTLLAERIGEAWIGLNPRDAAPLGIENGSKVQGSLSAQEFEAAAVLDEGIPLGVILIPRSMGIPLFDPSPVEIRVLVPAA